MRYRRPQTIILATLILIISACAGLNDIVQEPRLLFKQVTPRAFSLAGASFDFDFDVQNPNPLGVRLSRVTYQLALNQHPLASGSLNEGVDLPARGSAPLTIPVSLQAKDLIAAVGDLGRHPKLPYQLNGKVHVGPLAIPYDVAGELEMPRLPKIELTRIQIQELNLRGAQLACQVRLTNRNSVPLETGKLAYQLQLGEIRVATGETQSLAPLKAGGSQIISLATRVHLKEAGMGLLKLLQSGGGAAYTLSGSFSQALPMGGNHQTPFSFSGQVPIGR